MALGPSAVNTANKFLDLLGGTSWTPPAGVYARAHTGDPGSAGTANASAETDRKAVTFGAANAGSKTMSGTISWTGWDAGTETISHLSLWTASSGGDFLWSLLLVDGESDPDPKTVNDGDTLTITALTLSLTGLAA